MNINIFISQFINLSLFYLLLISLFTTINFFISIPGSKRIEIKTMRERERKERKKNVKKFSCIFFFSYFVILIILVFVDIFPMIRRF